MLTVSVSGLTLVCWQGELHWSEPQHHQVSPSVESSQTSQDYQESSQTEGGLRLRGQLTEKCLQHPDRLHSIPSTIFLIKVHINRQGRNNLAPQPT